MFSYQLARVKVQDAFREVKKMSLLRKAIQSRKANYLQRLAKLFQRYRLTRNHQYEGGGFTNLSRYQ